MIGMKIPSFVTNVSRAFLDDFSLDGGRTECFGLFICRLEDEHFVAVNNQRGQRWQEEFRSLQTAMLWLQGHMVLNYTNDLCDGLTGERIPDVAERVKAEVERERERQEQDRRILRTRICAGLQAWNRRQAKAGELESSGDETE